MVDVGQKAPDFTMLGDEAKPVILSKELGSEDELLANGIELFNAQYFFEAHELFEDVWMKDRSTSGRITLSSAPCWRGSERRSSPQRRSSVRAETLLTN